MLKGLPSLHIRQRGNTNLAPKLLHKNRGTSLQRCTGGKDIIHQEGMATGRGKYPAIAIECKRSRHIMPSLQAVLGRLGGGKGGSLQQIGKHLGHLCPSGSKPRCNTFGNNLGLVVSPFHFLSPMERHRNNIINRQPILHRGNLLPQHLPHPLPDRYITVIFEHMHRSTPLLCIIKQGIDPLHIGPAPEYPLCRIFLHIPEPGKGHVCKALQTKMLLVVIQNPTTNSALLWEQQIEQQSPPLHLH